MFGWRCGSGKKTQNINAIHVNSPTSKAVSDSTSAFAACPTARPNVSRLIARTAANWKAMPSSRANE